MGSITAERHPAHNLTIFRIKGTVNADELLEELRSFYGQDPTRFTLWDFTSAHLSNISTEDISIIAEFVITNRNADQNGRSALVFASDVDYGIGRMYDTQFEIEQSQALRRSFRSIDEAMNWLGIDLH